MMPKMMAYLRIVPVLDVFVDVINFTVDNYFYLVKSFSYFYLDLLFNNKSPYYIVNLSTYIVKYRLF